MQTKFISIQRQLTFKIIQFWFIHFKHIWKWWQYGNGNIAVTRATTTTILLNGEINNEQTLEYDRI